MIEVAKTSDFGVLFSTVESGRTREDNIGGRDKPAQLVLNRASACPNPTLFFCIR